LPGRRSDPWWAKSNHSAYVHKFITVRSLCGRTGFTF